MARSIKYWYDIMIAEKNSASTLNGLQPNIDSAQTLLTDITTPSKVARWRLWIWVVASAIYALDLLFDLLKLDLEAIASNSRYGTLPWYVDQAKKFQYGDTLVWMNNQYQYATDNPSARIISMAAAIESPNGVVLKVAKLSGSTIVPLDPPEVAGVSSYFNNIGKVKPAGIPVTIKSQVADQLQVFANINYDPLVLTSTGELISSPGTFPVSDTINNFIKNLDFNGTLELSALEDAIQATTGVVSAYLTQAKARYGTNPFIAFPERYIADAGYMIIDPSTDLTTTITYTASV